MCTKTKSDPKSSLQHLGDNRHSQLFGTSAQKLMKLLISQIWILGWHLLWDQNMSKSSLPSLRTMICSLEILGSYFAEVTIRKHALFR